MEGQFSYRVSFTEDRSDMSVQKETLVTVTCQMPFKKTGKVCAPFTGKELVAK